MDFVVPEYNLEHGIYWVTLCWDCAKDMGWNRELAYGVCTSYECICGGCMEMKNCTQPRDFGFTEEEVLLRRRALECEALEWRERREASAE